MKKMLSFLLITLMMISSLSVSAIEAGSTMNGTNILGYNDYYAAAATPTVTSGAAKYSNSNTSEFTVMPSITAVGTGVSTGTTLYGDTVAATEYAEGDSLNDKLTDGYYFTLSETTMAIATGTNESSTYPDSDTKKMKPSESTQKMVKFTDVNSGVKISWSEGQTVARLHLWMWPADAIDKYEISAVYGGNAQSKVIHAGSLCDKTGVAQSADDTNSTFYAIVFDKAFTGVTELTFKIKSFADGYADGAYLTEIVPRSTNEINLISVDPRNSRDMYGANLTTNKIAFSQSLYVEKSTLGYVGTSVSSSVIKTNAASNYQNAFPIYSNTTNNYYTTLQLGKELDTGKNYMWRGNSATGITGKCNNMFYAVDFGQGKQKINKIKVGVHCGKTDAEIEANGYYVDEDVKLLCTDSDALYNALASDGLTDSALSSWTEVGSWEMDEWKKNTLYTYTVADAPEARYWTIAYTSQKNGQALAWYPGMYSLPDNVVSAENEFISGDGKYLLNDDVRYTYGQRMEKSYGATYSATSKFVKFTSANSGIEWDIPESTSVKRLDFWVWPKNAIDTFEVQKLTDGGTWTTVKSGDWAATGAALGTTEEETAAEFDSTYWQSVVLDEAVTDAKKLRFKITGFTDASYGAYIAEASYGTTNEINLLAIDAANNDGQSHSIYVEATTLTNNLEVIKKTADTDFYRNLTQYPIWKDAENTKRSSIWQAVKLAGTEHKINRIAIDVNTGTGKEFEVWCSNSASDYADPDLVGSGTSHTWQKVANVKGDVKSENNVKGELVIDIPNSHKAEYWMVRVTDRDASANFGLATATMRFYEMAESELVSESISGTLSAGKRLIFALDNYDELNEISTETDAHIYFALLNDNKLVSVLPEKDVKLDDSHNIVLYNVPDVSGTLSVRAFIWSGDGNLKPLAGDISYPAN